MVDKAFLPDPANTLRIQIWRIQKPNNLSEAPIILLLKRNMFTDVNKYDIYIQSEDEKSQRLPK